MNTEIVVNEVDGYKEGVQVAAVMLSWLRHLKVKRVQQDEIDKIWKGYEYFTAGEDLKQNDSVEVIDGKVYLFKGKRPFDYYAKGDAKKGERVETKVKSLRDIMEGK